MRSLIIIVLAWLAAAAACTTKRNDAVCCVSDADCARLGLDEPRPCEAGQACKAFECVAAECATAADCTSPEAPACADQLCVAACRTDDDCAGAAGGSRCAEDGACVGCFADTDCPGSAPFCDTQDRSCRGCEADAECASGVCLEADARCAAESEVVYVAPIGQDGECTRNLPCVSLAHALTKVFFPTRLVVHVAGGTIEVPDTTLEVPVYIDGSGTMFSGDGSGPYFRSISAAPATLSNLTIDPASGPAVTAAQSAALRLHNATLTRTAETIGGTLIIAKSKLSGGPAVTCSSGVLSVSRSLLFTDLQTTNCQLEVSASTFDAPGFTIISATGGRVVLENNLFLQSNEDEDTVNLVASAPGSAVRFNTFVNTSNVVGSGVALYCDAMLDVTSNIFAYGTDQPHGASTCAARYSLYDAFATPAQAAGEGNRMADSATFFADRGTRDFHLAPTSPARGGGEPGTGVTTDRDGRRRPTSGAPDMGAFEAP